MEPGRGDHQNATEPFSDPRVIHRMATKPLLPEVVAERAQATEDYRKEQQAAIDRISSLRAARLKRDTEDDLRAAQLKRNAEATKTTPRRVGAKG
jgi:hypothetical protein